MLNKKFEKADKEFRRAWSRLIAVYVLFFGFVAGALALVVLGCLSLINFLVS